MRKVRKWRRFATLGSTKQEHKYQEDFSLKAVESVIVSVRKDLDAVENGDVYSCDQALHSLLNASYISGQARADVRAQGRSEPDNRFSKIRDELDIASGRFHKVCIIPGQRRRGG